MKYKLLAADIDGTLLNQKGELSENTIKAVKTAIKSGVKFVLSTGRPFQAIGKFVKAFGLDEMPYILYNGAMVMIGGKVVYSLTLDEKDVVDIVFEGHKRSSTMVLWAQNKLYSEADNEKVDFYKSISGVEPIVVSDLSKIADKGVTKLVWYDDPEKTALYHKEMQQLFCSRVNVHPSRIDFLEFVNKNCSKATAMQIIGNELNIAQEEMVAVGDGFNDVPMLDYAGLGVAVDNACDEVKSHCKLVVSSCNDDGVAELIYKHIL